jgi:hypothetical protein
VIGRGISLDSRDSASAVASAGPIQIGSLRSPPDSDSTMMWCSSPSSLAALLISVALEGTQRWSAASFMVLAFLLELRDFLAGWVCATWASLGARAARA